MLQILIQNLCSLSDYTEAYHVCHMKHYILHIQLNTFRHLKCPYPGRNEQKMSIFTSIWIERTLTQRCQSILKLVRNTSIIWPTFILCLRFKALIVFDWSCSHKTWIQSRWITNYWLGAPLFQKFTYQKSNFEVGPNLGGLWSRPYVLK